MCGQNKHLTQGVEKNSLHIINLLSPSHAITGQKAIWQVLPMASLSRVYDYELYSLGADRFSRSIRTAVTSPQIVHFLRLTHSRYLDLLYK